LSHSRHESKSIVEQIEKLPSLPEVGLRILELASDPEVSIDALSHAINQDPPLAARVLKVANSPFYGMSRQVDSLQLAIVLLGLNEVRNIALGILIMGVIKDPDSHAIYKEGGFWLHCAGCGVVARILGRMLGFRSEGIDFAAGLLHDIGKIIIDEYFGSKFSTVFEKTFKHKPPMLEAEKEILGASHAQIGGWLTEKWSLPETLCEAIAFHHDFPSHAPWDDFKSPKLASLSFIAEAFCDRYEVGWDGDSGASDIWDRGTWETLLAGQSRYTIEDVDTILKETLQAFHQVRPHLLWIGN